MKVESERTDSGSERGSEESGSDDGSEGNGYDESDTSSGDDVADGMKTNPAPAFYPAPESNPSPAPGRRSKPVEVKLSKPSTSSVEPRPATEGVKRPIQQKKPGNVRRLGKKERNETNYSEEPDNKDDEGDHDFEKSGLCTSRPSQRTLMKLFRRVF